MGVKERGINPQYFGLGDILATSADLYPNHPAIVAEGKETSFKELNDKVNSFANALISLGLKKGEKVAIYFYNSLEFAVSSFAVTKVGGVVVPINVRLAPSEIAYQINHSDSVFIIYGEEFSLTVDSVRSKLTKVRSYICTGETIPHHALFYDSLLEDYSPSELGVQVSLEDDCLIYYTSGTTGLPKGALRTHASTLWEIMGISLAIRIWHGDKVTGLSPFFHLAGFAMNLCSPILVGATIYIMKAFDPVQWLQTVEREKITISLLLPPMVVAVQNTPGQESCDLSSLRTLISGASPLLMPQKEWIFQRLPNINLVDTYGLSEAGCVAALYTDDQKRKGPSVGKAHLNNRLRVVNEQGGDVPRGEIGEVVVRGPIVFKEYYKDPEATKAAIREGWLHTGDMGKLDEEGYLYLVDRKKDMILTGGENVYSAEVENVLIRHPAILECAVIGLPHEKWGEAVTAVVSLKEGSIVDEKTIIDHCRSFIAGYKCPKSVIFLENLPRSSVGKVLKRELRKRFKNHFIRR